MSETVIGASIDIEYKSIKDLKTALEGTEKQFKEMVDTFGEGSEQAQQAQKKMLSLQDGINEKTEAYNQKVDNAAATVSALNATVGGLQGALELTGLASEETEKALSKLTAALSIGDAIQNLAEFGPAIKGTFDMIAKNAKGAFNTMKTVAVNAFKSIRGALIASGIGALTVALGLIVAYWDDIKEAVFGTSAEMKKLNAEAQKTADAAKETLDQISRTEATLKRQGLTERQILKIKIAAAKVEADARQKQFEANSKQLAFQKAAAERNQKILAGILKWVQAPLVLIARTIDGAASLLGLDEFVKLEKQIDNVTNWAASFVFDPVDIENKNNELKIAAETSKNTYDQYLTDLDNMDKAAADKRKAERDKQRAEAEKEEEEKRRKQIELAKAANEQQAQIDEALLKRRMTARDVELYDLQQAYLKQVETLKAGGKSTVDATKLYLQQRADIEKKYREEQLQKEKEYRDLLNGIIAESEDNTGKTELQIALEAIEEKYVKRREEIIKKHGKNRTLLLALAKAEQAEVAKAEEEERIKKLQKQEAKLQKDAADTDLSFKKRNEALKAQLDIANQLVFDSEDERKDYIKKINKDIAALRKEERDKLNAAINDNLDKSLGALSVIKQANDADLAIKKEQYNQDLANLQQMLDNKEISQEQFEARRKELDEQQNKELLKSFKRNQILSIAEAVINTAKGVTAALTLPPPFSFIQAAATALLGGLQIKAIKQQKPEQIATPGPMIAGAGGGEGAPMQASISPALQGQVLNAEAINNLGNNAMRAYVLNSDIQNNQQRNAYLQRNARIG